MLEISFPTPESFSYGVYFDVRASIFDAMMSVLKDVNLKILLRGIIGENILQISHVVTINAVTIYLLKCSFYINAWGLY